MSEREIQDQIGAVLHQLAALEPKAAQSDESRATRHLLADFRRLARDLERSFERLRESAARQEASQRDADRAQRRAALLLGLTALPSLVVHSSGVILEANDSAAAALRVPLRQLKGRSLQPFLNGDGPSFLSNLERVSDSMDVVRWSAIVHPSDGPARSFTIVASSGASGNVALVMSEPEPEALAANPAA
jgi:hypothetical protein